MHALVVMLRLVLSLKRDPHMVAVTEWRHGDSMVQPLTPALVVVLSSVMLHKTDETMVAVMKCNHKNAPALPFTHALVVVPPLV